MNKSINSVRYRNYPLIILLVVSVFGLTGCYDPPEVFRQKVWNEDLDKAVTIERQFRDYGTPLLLTEQLIALIGEPDYKMFPTEFEKILPDDAPPINGLSYSEWHMIDLWCAYRQAKKQLPIYYSKTIFAGKWQHFPDPSWKEPQLFLILPQHFCHP